jgi:5-methylcytosine-specific restriction enzyme subunit McrC
VQRLELIEYQPRFLEREELSEADGEVIYRRWASRVEIDFPSPKTNHRWKLTSVGWAGYLPVTSELALEIQPKVSIQNLLRMFEHAYGLKSVEFHDATAGCATLADFYSKLAQILAQRVLLRVRRGLYRGYIPVDERLSAVRGRIDIRRHVSNPSNTRIDCHFEEHTADLVENQLLTWTLSRIVQNASLSEAARPLVRTAYRAMHQVTARQPFYASDCLGRLYNRLNDDYEQLHLLCRFFLEHTGPTITDGETKTVPFVVNMARLFELFVAEWLRAWLRQNAARYTLRYHDRTTLGENDLLKFDIDMVLYDSQTARAVAVIDAKYKVPDQPSSEDVAQITLYAQLRNCREAILVYPTPLTKMLDAVTAQHHLRSLFFDLDEDLDVAGERFAREVLRHA